MCVYSSFLSPPLSHTHTHTQAHTSAHQSLLSAPADVLLVHHLADLHLGNLDAGRASAAETRGLAEDDGQPDQSIKDGGEGLAFPSHLLGWNSQMQLRPP